MRLIGCGLLALTFASSGWASEHYVEIWNPPEARQGAAHAPAARVPAARMPGTPSPAAHANPARRAPTVKLAARHHHHAVQALVKTRAHRAPTMTESPSSLPDTPPTQPLTHPTPGRLMVMQAPEPSAPQRPALDYTDIPRQYTPDGNVLRVGARNGPAEVTR